MRGSPLVSALMLAGCASQQPPPTPVATVPPPPAVYAPPPVTPPPVAYRTPEPVKRTALPSVPAAEPSPPPPQSPTPEKPVHRDDHRIPDAAIIAAIISQSRASYRGNCGCPDDRDRAGRRCGGRSAYSRAGGRSVICYEHNVTPQMIALYRASN